MAVFLWLSLNHKKTATTLSVNSYGNLRNQKLNPTYHGNRKSAAILSSNKQMQSMHSREIFHSKNQTKPQQRKGSIFIVPPQKETFFTKLPVAWTRKKTTQGRNGYQTHLSHNRKEQRTSDTFVLRSKHQCRMKRI